MTTTTTPILYLDNTGRCVCAECVKSVEGFNSPRVIRRSHDALKSTTNPAGEGYTCAVCGIDFYGWSGLMEDAELAAANAIREGLHATRANIEEFVITYVGAHAAKLPGVLTRLTTQLWGMVSASYPNIRMYPGNFGPVLIWQEA